VVEDVDLAASRDPNIHVKMMRDPQIYACFQIRAYATASLPWAIIPKEDSQEGKDYANRAETMLRELPSFPSIIKNILLSVPMGLSIQEVVWWYKDDLTIVPHRLWPVHKDRFVFDLDGRLALRSPIDVFWGESVPEYTFIPHVSDQLPGSFYAPHEEARQFYGFGLNDVLYPTWMAKQIIMRMDLRYLERFANAYRVGRYPRRNVQGRDEVRQLFDDLMRDQVLLFPSDEGYDIELQEASQAGHASFQGMMDYLDRQISKAYLGSTLLLDIGDVGSYSLGRVHERTTFGRIAEYDHNAVASTFNEFLLPWIFELNGWPKQYVPRFEFTMKESQDINELIEALRVLQSMGFQVSAEMVTEQTGFRQAREGENILTFQTGEEGQMQVQQTSGEQDILSPEGRQSLVASTPLSKGLREILGRLERIELKMLQQQLNRLPGEAA
jgi:phage gp29-like protein